MTCDDVRLLVEIGYLACAPQPGRGASPRANTISLRSVVMLTPAGAAFLDELDRGLELWAAPRRRRPTARRAAVLIWGRSCGACKTHWQLSFEGVVIASYCRAAPVQHCILDSFQRHGWPERISDPLPPEPATPPDARLRDVIRCLNRKLNPPLIRFGADGTGHGVCWWPTK